MTEHLTYTELTEENYEGLYDDRDNYSAKIFEGENQANVLPACDLNIYESFRSNRVEERVWLVQTFHERGL